MKTLFGNTAKLLGGNTFAQVVGILSIPVITRIYGAEAFGYFAILLAASTTIAPLFSLSLHMSTIVLKCKLQQIEATCLSLYSAILFFMLFIFIFMIFEEYLVSLFALKLESKLIYFVPILAFLQSVYITITYLNIRNKLFGTIGLGKITESISDRSAAVTAGYLFEASEILLVISKIFGIVLSIFILKRSFSDIRVCQPRQILKLRYRGYILFNTPSMFVISAMMQLPVIVLGAYHGPILAGIFAIGSRVVGIPVQVIGNALSKTLTQHISNLYSSSHMDDLEHEIKLLYNALLMFLVVPFSFVAVTGSLFVPMLLGDGWGSAGEVVQWLALVAMSTILVQAFGGIFDITNSQKIRLKFQMCNFILRVGIVVVLSIYGFEFIEIVIAFSIVSFMTNSIALYFIFRCIDSPRILLSGLGKVILIFITYGLLLVGKSCFQNDIQYLIVVSMMSLIFFTLLSKEFILKDHLITKNKF